MKLATHFLFIALFANFSFGQIIPSNCYAPDSIKDLYKLDVQEMALERIFELNSTYVDTIEIPTIYSDTILDALMAIYNLVGVPERDTVIDLLNIHHLQTISMNEFDLATDSNLIWMQNLGNGIFPTSQSLLDYYLSNYGFQLDFFYSFMSQPISIAYFSTNGRYNLQPIADTLDSILGVINADVSSGIGDGSSIFDTVYPTYIEFTFKYGWMDCPAGCLGRRFWKFKVYHDCSVEFAGSYGMPLDAFQFGVDELPTNIVEVFPNPFSNTISIKGIKDKFNYQIIDLTGKIILSKENISEKTIDVDYLENGSYLLVLETDNTRIQKRIVKK